MSFVPGRRVHPPSYWPRVRKRSRWAVMRSGYTVPKINFHFRSYLKCDGDQLMGYAYLNSRSGTIWISTGLCGPKSIFVDTLLHEIAHVLTMQVESPEHPHEHSDLWGLIYARLYRSYVDDPEGPRD